VAAFFAVPIAAIIQAFLATYSRQYDIIESDLTRVDTPNDPRTRPVQELGCADPASRYGHNFWPPAYS
jgi:hypothetical protein